MSEQKTTCNVNAEMLTRVFFSPLSGHHNHPAHWKPPLEDAKLRLRHSTSKSSPAQSVISTGPIQNPRNYQHVEKHGTAIPFLVD